MTDISNILQHGSASAVGAAIAAGTITSVDATRWYLQRIAQHRDLNAVRNISPLALEQAARADAERTAGQCRGPLHGVPYLIKDNVFTADGCSAAAGALALADFVPPYEATIVQRLREAGAVLLGKTNLTEFADFVADTMPSEFSGAGGVVRHPLGLRYERGGGSSVGSAAAVAAGLCAFAIGTETQNSIQTPAVHSSIVGYKPSVGRVSRHGIVPLVPSQDTPGPLTRTVADAVLVAAAIAGADMHDAATLAGAAAGASEAITVAHVMAGTVADTIAGLRIGIPRRYLADNALTASRTAAFARTLDALAAAGAVIVDPCDLPGAEPLHDVRSSVFRTEFNASLNALLATLQPCGLRSMADLIAWNRRHPDAIPYGQSLLEAAEAAGDLQSPAYVADRRRDIVLSVDAGINAALKAGAADVLLAPMSAAAKCTGKAGAPVVAIPAGADADGLPFGITVFAAPGADRTVLQAATAIERVVGQRLLPR